MHRRVLWLALCAAVSPVLAHAGTAHEVACGDAADVRALAGSLCQQVPVPLRHEQPDGEAIDLFVRRIPVAKGVSRRGEVWLIAGGPGESGASLYPMIATYQRAFPGYDLVIPDHRGVGRSARICPEQEAADSPDGVGLHGSEWGPCIGAMHANRARTHAFTTNQAAHDLAGLIRVQRRPGEVLLYGVSYGTQLVLRTLRVDPVPVDGVILDGLVPPELDATWDLSHRTALVDAVGREVLGADHLDAYRQVIARSDDAAWKQDVPGGDLRRFMGTLLNFPDLRARMPAIIAGLSTDDPTVLRQTVTDLRSTVAGMGQGGDNQPSLPLVMLISGSENNARPGLTRAIVDAESADALFTSAIPGFLVDNPVPLYARDASFGALPARLPRMLIVHGTWDPNTAYAGARDHAVRLQEAGSVTFATVERGAHLLAYAAPQCFVSAVSAFVASTAVPVQCREP